MGREGGRGGGIRASGHQGISAFMVGRVSREGGAIVPLHSVTVLEHSDRAPVCGQLHLIVQVLVQILAQVLLVVLRSLFPT